MEFGAGVQDIVTSVPFGFFVAVLLGLCLYWLGGKVSAKGKPSDGKLASYACGEELPAEKVQVNLQTFFMYAVYFVIFDILAFMLATSLTSPGILPAAYALIMLLAVVLLLPLIRR